MRVQADAHAKYILDERLRPKIIKIIEICRVFNADLLDLMHFEDHHYRQARSISKVTDLLRRWHRIQAALLRSDIQIRKGLTNQSRVRMITPA